MKFAVILILLIPFIGQAAPILSARDFQNMTIEQQVSVLTIYKEFLREASSEFEPDKFSALTLNFFPAAYANGNFNCFYAGWPSRTVRSGRKRLCTSPANGNPDYRNRAASSCNANQLLCQPMIFGEGLCANIRNRAERNSAFRQCEQKFSESGKTLAEVAAGLNTPEKLLELNELVSDSESICRTGLQANTNLCRRLREKILAVKAEAERTQGQALRRVGDQAVRVTTNRVEPLIDCDPNTPGIQTEPPETPRPAERRPEPRTPTPRAPATQTISRQACPQPSPTRALTPRGTLEALMSANNIRVVAGTADTRDLQNFMEDFSRFPASLRDEMKARGARIHLIVGQGVSEDPSWAQERAAAPENRRQEWDRTHDGRPFSEIPGTGGSTTTPTRIVINRLYEGHGSASLFLHEYAHTLDRMYGEYSISRSSIWRESLSRDTNGRRFLSQVCQSYCLDEDHPEEAFAELFAYYHACPQTRTQLREYMPNISWLFENMSTVRDLLDGKIRLGERIPPSRIAQ